MDAIQRIDTPRLMIAGTGSGSGKTTVMCAVLGALQDVGLSMRSFKCGPDYIDPMFHTKILGIPCRNLDSFLCGDEVVKHLFARSSPSHCISLIEGVMGYYDGLSGTRLEASSHHIAQLINAPVVLVVNCRGKSLSVAAEIQGYLNFTGNRIVGVIFNEMKEHSYPMYKEIVERHCGIEVLGYLPTVPEATLESRHLGLVTAGEVADLRNKMQALAQAARSTINLERLLALARGAGELRYISPVINHLPTSVPVAVAHGDAFCFYYKDSLELLEMLGAQLVPFSPLVDKEVPPEACGLILGGGYPELYARQLSYNVSMLNSLKKRIGEGVPTLAECGGFMLLCDKLKPKGGKAHPMAGVIPTSVEMTESLNRFGYVTLTAREDNVLCRKGESIPAHEFHYSTAVNNGNGFTAAKANGRSWNTAFTSPTMYAGYPHMHLWGNPQFAQNFVQGCIDYRRKRQ